MRSDLPWLTVVRFAAALCIALFHFASLLSAPWPLQNALGNAFVGTTFFFLLSGFVLAYISQGENLELRSFLTRRVARIYPLYALAFLVTALGVALNHGVGEMTVIAAQYGTVYLTITQAWIPGFAKHWNWPGWSLSCEVFFYVCFPVLYLYLRKLSTRALWICGAGLLLLTGIKFYVCAALAKTSFATTTLGEYCDKLPVLVISVFLSGVVMGTLYSRGVRLRAWTAVASAGAIVLILIGYPKADPHNLQILAWLTPLFCVQIMALASLPYGGHRIWILLGQASYAICILQQPLHEILRHFVRRDSWGSVLAFLMLLIACAVATHLYVERPIVSWIRKRLGRDTRNPVAMAY